MSTVDFPAYPSEPLIERFGRDIIEWYNNINETHKAEKVAQFEFHIHTQWVNPEEKKLYAILHVGENSNSRWHLQEGPVIKKGNHSISFKVLGDEILAKESKFKELEEGISNLTDPKWLPSKMVIAGYASDINENMLDSKNWSYIFKK